MSSIKRLAFRAAVTFCVTVLGVHSAIAAPANRELPKPTGKYPVGRMTFFWTDDTRDETFTSDESDHRQLRVDVWYPAEPRAGEAPGPYCPNLKELGKRLGAEAILFSQIVGHTYPASPIVPGTDRFPVIVLSPGFGTNAIQYTDANARFGNYPRHT